MKFNFTQDAEDYVRDIIGIPYVNFEGIAIEVCNELVATLEEIFSLYPLLKQSICTIGPSEYIEGQVNLISNSADIQKAQDFKWDEKIRPTLDHFLMASYCDDDEHGNLIYIALNIGPIIYKQNLAFLNNKVMLYSSINFFPKHCKTFKSLIYHELGHIFDYVLKISKKKEFLELLQTFNIEENISVYASQNAEEAFAEAFAEYHSTNEPNQAVSQIVAFGLAEYRKRAENKSEIFDVSRKFR